MAIEGTTRFDKVKEFEKNYIDDKVSRKNDRIRQKSARYAERYSSKMISGASVKFSKGWEHLQKAIAAKEAEEFTCIRDNCNTCDEVVQKPEGQKTP